jgi:hypothetical protein
MTSPMLDDPESYPDVNSNGLLREHGTVRWPKLSRDAFYGLAGQIVQTIEPYSEADPAALLLQFLTTFGAMIGPYPHLTVGADKHPVRMFIALVGETGRGRKGTSWSYVRKIFEKIDKNWVGGRIKQGLSSGEGLIWDVRDGTEAAGGKLADPGCEDKRLLVIEPEFSSVLRQMERNGNTLSAVLRQAWDGQPLSILTKHQSAIATEAHVSLISHITTDELLRLITSTDKANGFANRFLWAMVKRSKFLPEGGMFPEGKLEQHISRLTEVIEWARFQKEIKRDPGFSADWSQAYKTLSGGVSGLLGAITSRADAISLRLALAYALLDQSLVIRREHLCAALAIWDYCETSARHIFGDSVGDPVADRILEAVRESEDGMSRTEITKLFDGHLRVERMELALRTLSKNGVMEKSKVQTEGRPIEIWKAV